MGVAVAVVATGSEARAGVNARPAARIANAGKVAKDSFMEWDDGCV